MSDEQMFGFENTYASLPGEFYEKVEPTPVASPKLIKFNTKLAAELQLPEMTEEEILEVFSGNKLASGSETLAQAYAGHQFGNFVPKLGDGRAILLGEVLDTNGQRKDIQLKGSGRTAFSRSGDGRAWLGPVIREYIVSEAMNALGVATTRSLAAVTTGEDIYRESVLPGAILTRVASSHIRVGTFEYFSARKDIESLRTLADYVIERHYPELKTADNPYPALLEAVLEKQINLVVQWMSFGFIHGVMNTDNFSVSGETIDYGPCAFMDFYHADTVFSSIDRYGRYAYQNQANICQWNLSCLANTLLPLLHEDAEVAIKIGTEILNSFGEKFPKKFSSAFTRKIGIQNQRSEDYSLVQGLLSLMQKYRADFTLSFRYLSEIIDETSDLQKFLALFDDNANSEPEIKLWIEKWRVRLGSEEKDYKQIEKQMNQVNPLYIPRNHRIEEAIERAHLHSDYSYMEKLLDLLSNPFDEQEEYYEYSLVPENKNQDYVTFCGT